MRFSHRAAALLGSANGIDPDGREPAKGSEALAIRFFFFFFFSFFFKIIFSFL